MPPDSQFDGVIRDPAQWQAWVAGLNSPMRCHSTAGGAFLVSPNGFSLAAESASDNVYMAKGTVDTALALRQHHNLAQAVGRSLPVQVFPGSAATPDAVFPNNVFATVPGKLIIGAMRHAVRQRESLRSDVPAWFADQHGYSVERIDRHGVVAELTGPLIIDHARGIGYCGVSERVNELGVRAMQQAFDLRAVFAFNLVAGEYHSNVVMSVLAGRALVIHAPSFADAAVPKSIAALYGLNVMWLSDVEKSAFVGNCIALRDDEVWMSARAAAALSVEHRELLTRIGFAVRSVDISEIEKAGGSLRCCIGEIW
ncbi:MAG: arginine deiminase-related protein [Pseudomonadota bacterium]|nr:arginine deiminase-related protein [Pseudomonadota bacterium]